MRSSRPAQRSFHRRYSVLESRAAPGKQESDRGIENPETEEINRRHSAPSSEPQQADPDARIQRSYGQKEERRLPVPEISSQQECWGMLRDIDRHQACAEEHVQADGRDT